MKHLCRVCCALALICLSPCFAQSAVSFRYFYYDSGELFRVLDSTGTLVEYIIDSAGNITQTNRSTVATSAPAILSLAPFTAGTGANIIIYGQNFSLTPGNNVVMINGVAATLISATANQLVVQVPSGVTAGQVTVTVNGVTVSSGPTVIFTPLAMPTIISVSPDGVLGGQSATVTVTGTNLTGATFSFPANGPSFTASNITATSATLQITTTAGVRGAYPLVATLPDGFSTSSTLTPSNSFTIWLPTDEADSALVSVLNPAGVFNDPHAIPGTEGGLAARRAIAARRDLENLQRRVGIVAAVPDVVSNSLEQPRVASAFSSGSTGSDGALNFTSPGVYDFDPVALGLNPAGDNIFNFTTVNIAAGVTVNMRASRLREKPVVFLASGPVTINGTLSVNGQPGYPSEDLPLRSPAEPGPGGYPGGITTSTLPKPQEIGGGPGGSFWCGAFATAPCATASGSMTYGNSALDPLRGGSGGGAAGGGGGAGGGAIQIVSSTSIAVNGSITAIGGSVTPTMFSGVSGVFYGGSQGSGGAIHLQAPTVSGSGVVSANGGTGGAFNGYASGTIDPGWVRIDANTNSITPASSVYMIGSLPASPDLPSGVGTVTVTNIGGVAVPAVPQGSLTNPDLSINSGTAVAITVSAANIPLGTAVTLILIAQDYADQVDNQDLYDQVIQTTPLTGTVASSTATANVVLRGGTTLIFARAVW